MTLAVGRNGKLDPDPDYAARSTIECARSRYPDRLTVQRNSLSAKSPLPGEGDFLEILWDNRPNIAAQMLWFTYGDPNYRNSGGVPSDPETTLRRSVDTGLSYGMRYIEIYQRDVINLPDVIGYAHSALTKVTAFSETAAEKVAGEAPRLISIESLAKTESQEGIRSDLEQKPGLMEKAREPKRDRGQEPPGAKRGP